LHRKLANDWANYVLYGNGGFRIIAGGGRRLVFKASPERLTLT
jgi:hypothetical protein